MPTQAVAREMSLKNQALEVAIRIGLAALLVTVCLLILRPFIPFVTWGIIIAVASYPAYLKLERMMKGRGLLAAIVWTLLLLAVLIIPIVLMGQSVITGLQPLMAQLREGTLVVPPPPAGIESWPVIGAPVASAWAAASTDLTATLMKFAPQAKSALPGVLAASAGFGSALVQFFLSIVVAGVLLANAQRAASSTRALFIRVFGDQGPEYQQLVGATIRSVTFGILGVALIQSIFATIGFYVMGLPGASIWSVVFLFAAILQIGAVVLIPAVVLVFAIATKTKAILFLGWCVVVGLMDNVLKPLLLGRGAPVPVLVVFLGVIGGFMAMGIVGLFVGAIVLSVGYKLFLAWVEGGAPEALEIEVPE
jgi:predicted PurR-regulated permease PerM